MKEADNEPGPTQYQIYVVVLVRRSQELSPRAQQNYRMECLGKMPMHVLFEETNNRPIWMKKTYVIDQQFYRPAKDGNILVLVGEIVHKFIFTGTRDNIDSFLIEAWVVGLYWVL